MPPWDSPWHVRYAAGFFVFCLMQLQGCDGAEAIRQFGTVALVCGILTTIGTFMCGMWACAVEDDKSQRQCLFGCCPMFLLMTAAWTAFGILAIHHNCETLKSLKPGSCEWLDPPPNKFDLAQCCQSEATAPPNIGGDR